MKDIQEVKLNEEFIFEAKAEVSLAKTGSLFFTVHTEHGRFIIFEDNKNSRFYQYILSVLGGNGEQKIFYIKAKARRLLGNQYGEKAAFVKNAMTGEPMVEIQQAPDLVNVDLLRSEIGSELNKLAQSNERYGSFIRFALSKKANPQNQSFSLIPAGVKGGYSFKGGLLTHTVRMLRLIELEKLRNQDGLFLLDGVSPVNYDLMKVCAFIHEIGKCQCYTLSESGTPEKTIKGKINHHTYWTILEVSQLLEKYNQSVSKEFRLTENEKLSIQDIVASAPYLEGSDGLVTPKTKEAYLFNRLEGYDHRLAEIEVLEMENKGANGFVKLMNGEELFIGQMIEEPIEEEIEENEVEQKVSSDTKKEVQTEQQETSSHVQPQEQQAQTNQGTPVNEDVNQQPVQQGQPVAPSAPNFDMYAPQQGQQVQISQGTPVNEDVNQQPVQQGRVAHNGPNNEGRQNVYTPQQQWYNLATS